MEFEDEIFKGAEVDFQKLKSYGFIRDKNYYIYSRDIINKSFRANIVIYDDRKIIGKVYDLDNEEEYVNLRIKSQQGEFVNRVRDEYKKVLVDILKSCFIKKQFISMQANRISNKIYELYGDEPKHLFYKSNDFYSSVFRNEDNEKWYALIMNIDKEKINCGEGKVDILNVKLNEKKIKDLLKKDGYFLGYHMNKKSWITIILDDTIKDEKIIEYIIESHSFTERGREWIIPVNPKYYDIINCFNDIDTVLWKQSSKVFNGDIIYIYVTEPYSAILYKCIALEVNIPYKYEDENLIITNSMKIKLLERYDKNEYTFKVLNKHGIKAIRGPRYITKEFSIILNK